MDSRHINETIAGASIAFSCDGDVVNIRVLPEKDIVKQIYNLSIHHFLANENMLQYIRDLFSKSLIFIIAHAVGGEGMEVEKKQLDKILLEILRYINEETFQKRQMHLACSIEEKILNIWTQM